MIERGRPTATIRVVVCDDVAELRGLLRQSLEDDPAIEVIAEADNGRDGARIAGAARADVVVLDLSMPGLDGLEAIPLIARSSPETGIVVFSGFDGHRMRDVALQHGADRYVEKGEPLEELAVAVREVDRIRRKDAADGGRRP